MIRYKKNPRQERGEIQVDGKFYKAKYVGHGQFSRVYRVGDRAVYYTHGDCGKEVLAMFQYDRLMHLPEMIRHENITVRPGHTYYVFSCPWYRNVKSSDKSAWKQMKAVLAIKKEFDNHGTVGRVSIEAMQNFVDYIRRVNSKYHYVPHSIIRALQEIVNVASNCGNGVHFDLVKQNFGVNQYGVLIFRDPIYVRE
jgi:hypothetical protein